MSELPMRLGAHTLALPPQWNLAHPFEAKRNKLVVSKRLSRELLHLVPHVSDDSIVELVVVTDSEHLSAKGLAAYLSLANHAHGRVLTGTLDWFSRAHSQQLEIAEVRTGSLVLVIPELVGQMNSKEAIVLVGLLLTFLPEIIKAPANAYREYQEGALVRERRKRLRGRMNADKQLLRLDQTRTNELVRLIDRLLVRDRPLLPAAQRFSQESVREVILRVKRQNRP